MNSPETPRHSQADPNQIDYQSLHAEALELNHDSFVARAEYEPDAEFAEDLRFGTRVAQSLHDEGKLALAVGGYARDAAIARETGTPMSSKDIDMEVYGLPFPELVTTLEAFGHVDLVGDNFGIAKVKNPATHNVLDFSIPRSDSKVDKGHKGFRVTGNPDMTVREAARRRDLTINALALNPLTGELIDEYGGLQDIKDGVLRAVDPELFADDPLRVLRVMQFAGRFDYKVDPATAELCRSLDLTELPRERVGEEWLKLMTKSPRPSVGLEVARELGILEKLHPQLAVLDQIPQDPEWHPEGSVWNHSKLAADAAARVVRQDGLKGDDVLVVLYGALCHDLGKATTTQLRDKHGQMRLTSYGHEEAGVQPTKEFLDSLNLKHDVTDKILPIVRWHLYHISSPDMSDKQLQRFAQKLEPANIRLWDMVSRCDANATGQPFEARTKSYEVYERSLALKVAEKPAENIVQGRDLMQQLGMKPSPAFKPILEYLFDAQLDGAFTTITDGIAYYHGHEAEIQAQVDEKLAADQAEWDARHPKRRKR